MPDAIDFLNDPASLSLVMATATGDPTIFGWAITRRGQFLLVGPRYLVEVTVDGDIRGVMVIQPVGEPTDAPSHPETATP